MCGSEVERKNIQQEFDSTTLILLVCIIMLPTSYSVAETDDVW